jgi:hypothetical protein
VKKRKWEEQNMLKCKMIEGCKLEDLDDALGISIGQGNVKNGSKSHHVLRNK